MESLELTKDIVPVKKERSVKLKGIESFQLETEEEVIMKPMEIPEPVLKFNKKPTVVTTRKKDSIF